MGLGSLVLLFEPIVVVGTIGVQGCIADPDDGFACAGYSYLKDGWGDRQRQTTGLGPSLRGGL